MIIRYLTFSLALVFCVMSFGCSQPNPIVPDSSENSKYSDAIDAVDEFSSAMLEIWTSNIEVDDPKPSEE